LARHAPTRSVRLSLEAARALFAYAWPRNVRELSLALAAALALADDVIEHEHLPSALREAVPSDDERQRLLSELEAHAGNLTKVAAALGTSRAQVHRLLRRFKIERGRFSRAP
jgi:transcriptional regulator of acetoin/glycerol metabolism